MIPEHLFPSRLRRTVGIASITKEAIGDSYHVVSMIIRAQHNVHTRHDLACDNLTYPRAIVRSQIDRHDRLPSRGIQEDGFASVEGV